jgi:hypothetical protein
VLGGRANGALKIKGHSLTVEENQEQDHAEPTFWCPGPNCNQREGIRRRRVKP